MQKNFWKSIILTVLTLISILLVLPNFYQTSIFQNSKVNLGLDLKGGAHLLLEVDIKEYFREKYKNISDEIKKELRKQKLGYKNIKNFPSKIKCTLSNVSHINQFNKIVLAQDNTLIINKLPNEENSFEIYYDSTTIKDLTNKLLNQSIEIVRMRVDSEGTKEPIIQKQGEHNIILQLPGVENPDQLKRILGQTAKLTFHLVANNSSNGNNRTIETETGKLLIESNPILTGDMLNDVGVTYDQYNLPAVEFTLSKLGTRIFSEITKNNVGRRLAIILDDKLLLSPNINQPITTEKGIISGGFTIDKAKETAILLRSGSLPAKLTIIEERLVGPSLGNEAIFSGKKAGIASLIVIGTFMILIYGTLGIFANISLCLSLLYIFALMSMLNATLTMPGIAGIILTIGMAVDANILIYERIREELKRGNSHKFAIQKGFDSAFATIADSNITTLIAGILLYYFGVGVVKGFAVTLSIGIISSMFSAIIVTKLLIDISTKIIQDRKVINSLIK